MSEILLKKETGVIVVSITSEVLRFSASELQKYLSAALGVCIDVRVNSSTPDIILSVDDGGGERDSFSIINDNSKLLITGTNSRSVLYGVYHFLEMFCDISFYSPDFKCVPDNGDLVIPANYCYQQRAYINERQIRTEMTMTPEMVDWVAKNGFNTISANPWDWRDNSDVIIACEKRGLKVAVSGHMAYYFLKTADYFLAHPEWFPEVHGQRVKTKSTGDNFCYSQPEAIAECAKNIIIFCKQFPLIDSFNFWPGDGGAVCDCDKCRRYSFMEIYSNAVARIAEYINAELPHIRVSQLAYNFNLKDNACSALDISHLDGTVPTMFAFWGQDLATPLSENNDESHTKVLGYIKNYAENSPGKASIFCYHADTYMNSSMCPVFETAISKDIQLYKSLGIDELCLLWIPWNSPENPIDMQWLAYQNAAIFGKTAMSCQFDVYEYRRKYYKSAYCLSDVCEIEKYWDELNTILGKLSSLIFPFAPPRVSDAWGCGFNRDVMTWDLATDYGKAGRQRLEIFVQVGKELAELDEEVQSFSSKGKSEAERFKQYVKHCKNRTQGLRLIFEAQYLMQQGNWSRAAKLLIKALETKMPDEQRLTMQWLYKCRSNENKY